ncbi:MAG: hypothetical protein ACJ79S_09070 [Gemmatimonadaceae bacterium]
MSAATGDGRRSRVDAVVKIGGGLLAHPAHLATALEAVAAASARNRLLVVAGGGPFADAVREVDRRIGLADDAAHWMAILAMDQYAHLIASRLARGVVAHDAEAVAAALGAGSLPVLAPFRWLREADPLPHSWDVTSDSIAAWIAGALGAPRLLLVKPPGAPAGDAALDAHFARALRPGTTHAVIPAERLRELRDLGGAAAGR